ncbi:MAG: hypothetical protein ACRD0H_19570, partial [Actinomycetes bacterium]
GEAYRTEADCRTAVRLRGSWTELREAGFPPVEGQGYDPDELDAEGLTDPPDSWEQLQLDIPGLKEVISVRGRKVPLVRGQGGGTVADVAAYVAMCEEKHDNFGKTVDQTRQSLQTMREGCGGDDTVNAVEAWEAGLDDDADEGQSPPVTGGLSDPDRKQSPPDPVGLSDLGLLSGTRPDEIAADRTPVTV